METMKTMKRIFTIWLMMFVCVCFVNAQNDSQRKAQRQQLAKAQANHIAKEMNLSGEKRSLFIRTYCSCQKEIWALGPRLGSTQGDAVTEKDAQQNIRRRFEHSKMILSIREKYYEEYSKFLTQKEIQRVYELEKQAMSRLAQRNPNIQKRR